MNGSVNSNIYIHLLESLQKKERCVFATIVETHGSTPQKPASSAVFGKNGLIAGTIGGGSVEHRIQEKATEAVTSGNSGIFRFELNDDIHADDSAICGGGMTILLDAAPEKHLSVFEALNKSFTSGIPGVLLTKGNFVSNSDFTINRFWVTSEPAAALNDNEQEEVKKAVYDMLRNPVKNELRELVIPASPETKGDFIILESIVPKSRLVIAGAGHVGKALSHFGKLLDFEVIVWDDREEYANRDNLPDADKIISGNVQNGLSDLNSNNDTFVVIVTRGHKNDSEVLKQVISSEAGYIGMIGSSKKVLQVREKSIGEGWATTAQWEKIHAPIGLKIGSETVEEIAVSIAAELIQVRSSLNGKNG